MVSSDVKVQESDYHPVNHKTVKSLLQLHNTTTKKTVQAEVAHVSKLLD